MLYKSYITFVYGQIEGEDHHLLHDGARPRDAGGGGALSRPQQERHTRQSGAQGVLARLSRWNRPHPPRSRGQGGEMRALLLSLLVVAGGAAAQPIRIGE